MSKDQSKSSVEWEKLTEYIKKYYEFRKMHWPTSQQAFNFIVSEVGELADVLNTIQSNEWVRNNPQNKHKDAPSEAADVLMMLTVFCMVSNIDLFDALQNKLRGKGFEQPW